MALQFVGGNTGTWAGATSGNNTVSLTALTGGISSSAAAGDIVIAVYATGSTADRTLSITDGTTAYTLINSELYSNNTFDTNLRVAYKVLTAADASTTFGATGNNADAGAAAVYVWRNEDSTPLDVAAVPNTGQATGRPNPAAITPTTAGAVIIVIGAGAAGTGATYTASYLTAFRTVTSADTNDAMLGIGYVNWTSGSYDPAAFTGGTTGINDSWAAMTIALRPMIRASSGTLTGQGSVITGSASRVAAPISHATSGTLTGQDSSIVGSATNFTPHSTSGTLTGQGSTVTGDADREPMVLPHTTEGTLVGQGSTVSGSATRFRAFATSGALTGQGSVIIGDADHEELIIPHTTEGVLVGQGATVTGSSTRYRQFASTGSLVGQQAVINGVATRYRQYTSSGVLLGQGSSIVGDAERIQPEHEASGDLVADTATVTGEASIGEPAEETNGAFTRRQVKPRLIVVSVDGKDYRVPETQLPAFLDALQQKIEQKPVVKKKRKKKAKAQAEVVELQELPQIVIKSAPVSIIPQVQNAVDEINTIIAKSFSKALQNYIQTHEDVQIEVKRKLKREQDEAIILMLM